MAIDRKNDFLFGFSCRWFQAYVVLGTTVGLFLPLAHVLGGFARGDDGAVRSATPHLFLLSCQILTENVVGTLGAARSGRR